MKKGRKEGRRERNYKKIPCYGKFTSTTAKEPTRHLLTPPFLSPTAGSGRREKKDWKIPWVKVKAEKSLAKNWHGQNKLSLGYLIYCKLPNYLITD